jgi:hypothetical protein
MVWRKSGASPVLREFLAEVHRLGGRGIRSRPRRVVGGNSPAAKSATR